MYKLLFFLVFCIFIATTASAQYNFSVINPQNNFNSGKQGIITSPEITVTPKGVYAQVEMTFTLNPPSVYQPTDSLEAVLTFDLPAGSFMHGSWLWLNETVIIKAAMVEKNRAIAIYEGIVKRRRDPSLLYKTGPNSYKLHVYPMAITYPRKVKLVYSTPMKWQNNKASVELPMKIFTASQLLPDVVVKVNGDGYYTTPSFADNDYSKVFVGRTGGTDALIIRGGTYSTTNYTLQYNIGDAGIQLFTYPLNANEGIYQLVVPPASIGINKPINTVFVLDHASVVNSINSLEQVKQHLKTSLLTNYSDKDSFNVFFERNGRIIKVFESWRAIDKATVDVLMDSLKAGVAGTPAQYENLIKSALHFCSGKGDEGEVVLVSNNMSYTNNQQTVDAMFANVKNHLGGTWKNKVHVLNYSSYKANIGGAAHNANDIWYTKLTLATGGALYKFNTYTSAYINGVYTVVYDLNVANVLSTIADNSGLSTVSYKVDIDVPGGFTYATYSLNAVSRLNLSKHYIETGKYSGNMATGAEINIQAVSGPHSVNLNTPINTVSYGDPVFAPAWTYHYMKELIEDNNTALVQEIIDSSINNRVLCEYTAFLALENGDTINTNINDNPKATFIGKLLQSKENMSVKCFPNPFSNELRIEFADGMRFIEIYDMMGRKILSEKIDSNKKLYVWNGKDAQGNALPSGMYMIVASTADERFTVKVMKQ